MNNRLRKLRALTFCEWRLLVSAFLMLPVVALLLKFTGYKRTIALLGKFISTEREPVQPPEKDTAYTVARMVSVAGRYSPLRANCLRQSIVLWWLLARQGLQSEIRFGVRKEPEEEFGAHAWVEFNGTNLCDSDDLQKQVARFKKTVISE